MDVDSLHILMTTDTIGGVWTYSLNLAKALEPYGVHIHLAAMGAMPSEAQKEQAARHSNVTLYSSNWQLEWMDNPWEEIEAAGHWLKYLQSEVRPDLIHLNNYAHGNLPWKVPVLMVGHSCVLSWWEAVKGETAPAAYDEYRQKVKGGLTAADLVVSPTAAFLEQLNHFYGPFKQQQVIHNGMAADAIKTAQKQPFILSLGRLWDEAKNIAFCDALAARELDWPLVVAGEQKHPNGNQISLPHLNTLGQLPQQEVARHLADAGIYLLPAKYEPFGLSILEAANAGCALVLGDIPTLRELWQDAAIFISTTDVASAHQQVQDLLHNKKQRQLLGQRARERAQQYTLKKQGKAYIELYLQLLQQTKQESQPSSSQIRNPYNLSNF